MLTIQSDGLSCIGTKILNADGVDLMPMMAVMSLSIDFKDANSVVTGTITVAVEKTSVAIGKAEWVTRNPATGQFDAVKAIDFKDGHRVVFEDDGGVGIYKNGAVIRFPDMSTGRTYHFKAHMDDRLP